LQRGMPVRPEGAHEIASVDVTVRNGARSGNVLWEESVTAAHGSALGYLLTVRPFEHSDDCRLSLPPFKATAEAYELVFWAWAHGLSTDVRVKLLFEDLSSGHLLDAWSVRLSSVAWRR